MGLVHLLHNTFVHLEFGVTLTALGFSWVVKGPNGVYPLTFTWGCGSLMGLLKSVLMSTVRLLGSPVRTKQFIGDIPFCFLIDHCSNLSLFIFRCHSGRFVLRGNVVVGLTWVTSSLIYGRMWAVMPSTAISGYKIMVTPKLFLMLKTTSLFLTVMLPSATWGCGITPQLMWTTDPVLILALLMVPEDGFFHAK